MPYMDMEYIIKVLSQALDAASPCISVDATG